MYARGQGTYPPEPDAAKVAPPVSDDKPLYVSRRMVGRLSGSPSPGQSGRSERDVDAESEGSRRSSLSQDPSAARILSRPREMAVKDVRQSDSDTESEGSRHSRRPSLSQDPNLSRLSKPANFELETQVEEVDDGAQYAMPNHGSYGPLHPNNYAQRPRNPNGGGPRPMHIAGPRGPGLHGPPSNMIPTAQIIRPPGHLLPSAHPIRAPGVHEVRSHPPMARGGPADRFRPPQVRPGPRPVQVGLAYPPGNPPYRPAMPNQPGNFPVRGPSTAKQLPQPGQAPVVATRSLEAERAARFGRNERGEPLQVHPYFSGSYGEC